MDRDDLDAGFRKLKMWQEARVFRNKISSLTKKFPSSEKYKLTDQIIRASRGITANIAEGYGRYHYQEFIQFCRHARGSLSECLDHLICALDENYLSQEEFKEFEKQYFEILRKINGYIAYLKKRKGNL